MILKKYTIKIIIQIKYYIQCLNKSIWSLLKLKQLLKKQEIDSLTEKLENLDINDTKKDKPNFLDDIVKPLFKIRHSNKLELPDTSTPLISKIDEKLKEAETSTSNPVNNTVNILEKDLSQSDDDFEHINKIYKK